MFLLFLIHGIKRGASSLPGIFHKIFPFSAVNAGGQCSSSLDLNFSGADGLKRSSAQVQVKPPVLVKGVSNLSFITTLCNPHVAGLLKIKGGKKGGEREEGKEKGGRKRGRKRGSLR